jgi:hypothetical protein
MVFNWHTTAPGAPKVTSDAPVPTDIPEEVQWTWTGDEEDSTFIYALDTQNEDAWEKTKSTSYWPYKLEKKVLTGGAHTLYVREIDRAGNSSAWGAFTVHIDTARDDKEIIPRIGSTSVPITTDFDWPKTSIKGTIIYYDFVIFPKGTPKNRYEAAFEISYFVNDPKGPQGTDAEKFREYMKKFNPGSTFIWGVTARDALGHVYYTSPECSFVTVEKIIKREE